MGTTLTKSRAVYFAQLKDIFYAGLTGVDPSIAVQRAVKRRGSALIIGGRVFLLDRYRRIYVVGAGKAAVPMAQAMEAMLGNRITRGIVVVKYGYRAPLKRVEIIEAGHPIPDKAGLEGAKRIKELVRYATQEDLIFCLLSGGASALLPAPVTGVTLKDKQTVTEALLASGAAIGEINAVRKHLSTLKGGQLARDAFPARLVTLILSDVVGDSLDVIASGPTVPDNSTFDDCVRIVEQYGLEHAFPSSVLNHLRRGKAGMVEETPKAHDPLFARMLNLVVANNLCGLKAAQRKARTLGYRTLVLSSQIEGESKEAAAVLSGIFKEVVKSGNPLRPPACVIAGGETTVTVRGKGKGGRNQELAFWVAERIRGLRGIYFLSAGTDGTDGPTEAAGAMVDGTTMERAHRLGIIPREFARENNTYLFFKNVGDLFVTGPTNTNVMDMMIALIV